MLDQRINNKLPVIMHPIPVSYESYVCRGMPMSFLVTFQGGQAQAGLPLELLQPLARLGTYADTLSHGQTPGRAPAAGWKWWPLARI